MMKPHPRIRKAIKWVGTAATLLLCALWALGRPRERSVPPYLHVRGYTVMVYSGHVLVTWPRRALGSPGLYRWPTERMAWLPCWDRGSFRGPWLSLPLASSIAVCAMLTAVLWGLDVRQSRRARAGLCQRCHYDRAGLAASTVCPECGAQPSGA